MFDLIKHEGLKRESSLQNIYQDIWQAVLLTVLHRLPVVNNVLQFLKAPWRYVGVLQRLVENVKTGSVWQDYQSNYSARN